MSSRGNVGDRFRDPLVWVERFADEVLVRCPACGECAVVLDHLGAPEYQAGRGNGRLAARRRLRCLACGLFKDRFPSERVLGEPVDPYFRLPLWLQVDCRGKLLWAYNAEHLDLLESYVAARLRERRASPGTMNMLARLPAWLKSAKNRDEILRAIRRLRSSLPTTQQ
ncbi:TFIIB-type zinc ribbon-containing protein [Actinophytocola sediminis]